MSSIIAIASESTYLTAAFLTSLSYSPTSEISLCLCSAFR